MATSSNKRALSLPTSQQALARFNKDREASRQRAQRLVAEAREFLTGAMNAPRQMG